MKDELSSELLVMERDTWAHLASAWERLGEKSAVKDCNRRVRALEKKMKEMIDE
jgi:hypothetical protein